MYSDLSCELLSKFINFVTRHNLNLKNLLKMEVLRGFSGINFNHFFFAHYLPCMLFLDSNLKLSNEFGMYFTNVHQKSSSCWYKGGGSSLLLA